jgi:hypothetical protein
MNPTPGILNVGDEPPPLVTTKAKPSPNGANGTRRPSPTVVNGKAGRFAVLNSFLDFTLRDLDRAAATVWLLLYRDTKADGLARTSQADLARRAGVKPRSVVRAVAKLRSFGLLTVVRQGGLRRGPSSYRVHPLAKPP